MIINKLYKTTFFITVLLLTISCSDKSKDGEGGRESSGGKTIIETGELAAVNSKSFVLARYGRNFFEMKVIGILEHGAIVSEGDSIIQLDPTEMKKFIIDRESNLETQLAALEKMKVDQDNKNSEYDSRIKSELASFDLKKIEYESSRFESERYRKIKELQFDQAKITLAKEKRKLELSKIIDANDFKIQEIRVNQIESEIKDAYNIIPALTIRTPISGVFQIAWNWRSNGLLKVGDNIYPGNNMANVPELKHMKVNTFINENDFLKINVGQKVAVRLDAMPKVSFDGEISYIGKLCHLRDQKSRQKVFDVEVNILKPDERLKPGMTVSCEFLESN
ncbi:MAG: HlyD family secretion protein [Dysgonomonas sp.]